MPELEKEEMFFEKSRYEKVYTGVIEKTNRGSFEYKSKYCLGEISNFNKLIAISNDVSIPIFELDPKRIPQSTESQVKTLRWFNFLYKVISWRVLRLIKNDDCKTPI